MSALRGFALTALVAAGAAHAAEPGGHRMDVGALGYLQAGDRGGGKAEFRYNLAPGELNSALMVSAGVGTGSWYNINRSGNVWDAIVGGGAEGESNFTEWKMEQTFLDLGLGVTMGHNHFAAGFMYAGWDARVQKKINGDPYLGTGEGSNIGGWGQLGIEIPMDRMYLDLALGFRQTRGKPEVEVKNAAGLTNPALIRPIKGFYFLFGLRYRI